MAPIRLDCPPECLPGYNMGSVSMRLDLRSEPPSIDSVDITRIAIDSPARAALYRSTFVPTRLKARVLRLFSIENEKAQVTL